MRDWDYAKEYIMLIASRPDRDEWLMSIALLTAKRSTCSRAQVGAIVVNEGRIISTGYNGAPSGMDHCSHEVTGDYEASNTQGCMVSVHAEANAIAAAAKLGISTSDSVMYTTLSPCYTCSQLIINAGIKEVVFLDQYRDRTGIDLLRKGNVTVGKYINSALTR